MLDYFQNHYAILNYKKMKYTLYILYLKDSYFFNQKKQKR
jgi:hypothetical protein